MCPKTTGIGNLSATGFHKCAAKWADGLYLGGLLLLACRIGAQLSAYRDRCGARANLALLRLTAFQFFQSLNA